MVFRPGERVDDVQITLSNRLSVVTGSVAADGGGPVKDYVVVVFAEDPNRWGQRPATSAPRGLTSRASSR